MDAALLSIGDELLNGQVVNSNAAWLGQELSAAGWTVVRASTVGDDLPEIRKVLDELLRDADVVICTGGLGPTHDDLTRQALAEHFERSLNRRDELVEPIQSYYEDRGRGLPAAVELMMMLPDGAEPIPNPVGVAPGVWMDVGEKVVAALPGIPHEMRAMMRETVLPRLIDRLGDGVAVQRTIVTAGAGESVVLERLGDLTPWLSDRLRLAILPRYGEVRLRVTALSGSRVDAEEQVQAFLNHAREQLGDLIFGEGDATLAGALGELLRERNWRLALAESCTGGLAGAAVTEIPGSSDYFVGSLVTYSNESKAELLGVGDKLIEEHGAVSEEVARAMAEGVRRRLGADVAASITGVAGPEGGTAASPVGTVWIGYSDESGADAVRLRLGGDRHTIRRLSVTAALDVVRRRVQFLNMAPG